VKAPGWSRALPPFILGGALASAALTSVGLLLYGGPGLLRALSVVVATLLGALAAGLVAGVRSARDGQVEPLRRWWLLTLVTFTLGALFAAGWDALGGFGAGAVSQGLGLSFLGGLPLFAGGAVLGSLGRLEEETGGEGPGVAVPALVGAGAGVVFLGFVLFPAVSPTGTLLLWLVALSGAAMTQGWVLSSLPYVEPLGREDGEGQDGMAPHPSVVLERWVAGGTGKAVLALMEEGRLRCIVGEGGTPVRDVDRLVVQGMSTWSPPPGPRLLLGAGGLSLLAGDPGVEVPAGRFSSGIGGDDAVVDRGGALLTALQTMAHGWARSPEPGWIDADPLVTLGSTGGVLEPGRWGVVALDVGGVAGGPGRFTFPPGALLRVREALCPGGLFVVWPLREGGGDGSLLERFARVASLFPRVSIYVGPDAAREELSSVPASRHGAWRQSGAEPGTRLAVLVASSGAGTPWPDRLGTFLRVRVTG
jgi:hypothetical protein